MPIRHVTKETNRQALTPALRELVEACFTLHTTDIKVLAAYLQRSPAAIRADFQRLRFIRGKHITYFLVDDRNARYSSFKTDLK